MSASWPLQQALFAALSSNATVGALARVFDAVPKGAAFPYVVIGEAEVAAAGPHGEEAHKLSVHVWSRGAGHREVKSIAVAVVAALDGAALAVSGHALVDLAFVAAEYARQPDGETWRAILRLRAVTEPN